MRRFVSVLAFVLMAGMASSVMATDKPLSFGVHGSWADDADLGVGGRLIADLGSLHKGVEGVASFDYFFPEGDVTYWEANANVVYKIPLSGDSSIQPYLGLGLNAAHGAVGDTGGSSTEIGLNILGGITLSRRFFVEGRLEAGGGEQLVVSGGIRF